MTKPYIARLEEQIHKIAAEMLARRIKDPRLGFVTITDVKVTGDGRAATIFYTDLGRSLDGREADAPDGKTDTPAALEAAKGQIRTAVGQQLKLKFTPTITFQPDLTSESAAELEELIDKVITSDAELASKRENAQFAGDADPYRSEDQ